MGLNEWWSNKGKAEEFLSTGNFNDVVLGYDPFSCTTTADCASGYACVNGKCYLVGSSGTSSTGGWIGGGWSGGSTGSISGPGECDPDPNTPGGCNQGGPGSCQSQANCGDGYQPRRCCGKRTCNYSAFGITCTCDAEIEFNKCSEFCDSYLAANGENGMGCTPDNGCGECGICRDGDCEPRANQPCWCDGGESCNTAGCKHCVTDPEDPDFGECRHKDEGCQECATVYNYLCPCDYVIPETTYCQPSGQNGPSAFNKAQELAAEQCERVCPDLPPKPECNCDDDCASCEYCNDNGRCAPDPECDEEDEEED